MKLSVISLIGDSAKDIDWFLKDLKDQTNQDFQVILSISKNTEAKKIFEVIKNHSLFFKNRLNVIYNSKLKSYEQNLINAFKLVKGKYVAVLNSDNNLKNDYIAKMIKNAEEANVDILEFKPRILGTTKFKPKARIEPNQIFNLVDNQEAIAYSFPFIFNKIFKKELVQKVVQMKNVPTNDSKICLLVNYLLLLEAKDYKYLDFRIYREYFGSDLWLNTKNFIATFDILNNFLITQKREVKEEINYAKYYFLKLILTGLLSETTYFYSTLKYFKNSEINITRSQKLIDKHLSFIQKLEDSNDFQNFKDQNIYMLKHSAEASMLSTPIKKLIKNKILNGLE
ncbi:glycosyltransferase [Mycoplasmopsis gallopavonis]|uniref:Glycosyl transferase family 2 n=1 Tax=Mycoplasmopsis gallopavonis TaxID=76629 RepID=A0A449B023_9BACT|nr:glycosyltransferase [Mycoplasmopsis gallopavonis]RIV16407.1 glycosyltransferase [Mycoplasmopsis gallopavonis]VEU73066.1 Glycosyl transferase family 2 [Mycoplasmopsis gallopavonis]